MRFLVCWGCGGWIWRLRPACLRYARGVDQQEFRIFMGSDGYVLQQGVESYLSRRADTTGGEVIFGDVFWDRAVQDVEGMFDDWGIDVSGVDVDEWCRELFPDGVEE